MELDSNEALVRWMEDEGLGPFTLLKVAPKPTAKSKKLPAEVVMEWGIEDLEHEGDRQRFVAWSVTAEGVQVYRGEGALDPFEECSVELGEGEGIDLRLEAGGVLTLRASRLVVRDEPVVRLRKGRPRPHHETLTIELDLSSTTWGSLREALGIPEDGSVFRHHSTERFDARATPTDRDGATVTDAAGHPIVWLRCGANRLAISRGKWVSDALWSDVWARAPHVPGVSRVSSRDLATSPSDWPKTPPQKPVPKVWPDVFGATCDFEHLTVDALRAHLGLPSDARFVFDDADAPALEPTLTLGIAARHAGRTAASGAFQTESGQTLFQLCAGVRESVLRFHRARACDDATWRAVWRASATLPGLRERNSRTTQSPPDPWPDEPPAR